MSGRALSPPVTKLLELQKRRLMHFAAYPVYASTRNSRDGLQAKIDRACSLAAFALVLAYGSPAIGRRKACIFTIERTPSYGAHGVTSRAPPKIRDEPPDQARNGPNRRSRTKGVRSPILQVCSRILSC